MITRNALTAAMSVCGQVQCDCGGLRFEVGMAAGANGNNFIRVLECVDCRKQMPIVHKSDAHIAPALVT